METTHSSSGSSLTVDILRKASDDAAQGMWCQSLWFKSDKIATLPQDAILTALLNSPEHLANRVMTLDDMLASPRCIEGSVAIATRMLGGDSEDFLDAIDALSDVLPSECAVKPNNCHDVVHHNDNHMIGDAPQSAGLWWADVARKAADRAAGI